MTSNGPHRDEDHREPETHSAPTRPTDRSGTAWRCDLCGAPMLDRHCKLVCTRCGYQRDCSDP